jgi:ParB family chromosome partitioning protein
VLRAGLHRLEACKILGWQEIPAIITTLTGLCADLVEVDENKVNPRSK